MKTSAALATTGPIKCVTELKADMVFWLKAQDYSNSEITGELQKEAGYENRSKCKEMQREGLNCFLCTYIYIHMNAEAYIIQHSHIVRKFKEHFPDLPGYVGHFPPNPNNCLCSAWQQEL